MAPMAMASPPRLMMSAPTPCRRMTRNAINRATGSVITATSADRAWNRKIAHTRATISISSRSFQPRWWMASSIRMDRSYSGSTRTPAGSDVWISRNFAFTASMVALAFCP